MDTHVHTEEDLTSDEIRHIQDWCRLHPTIALEVDFELGLATFISADPIKEGEIRIMLEDLTSLDNTEEHY